MITRDQWQEIAIRDLVALLEPDDDVLALILFGSLAKPEIQPDVWSDVDVLLVVRDDAMERFHSTENWLSPLGEIHAQSRSSDEFTSTIRVCFADLRWLDLVLAAETSFGRIQDWPSNPLSEGLRVLFSRCPLPSTVPAETVCRRRPAQMSDGRFRAMINDFRFKAALAVSKVVRDDLLVALHLGLDMVRDCCVLGMVLRDRAEGTDHRRHGGTGNHIVALLETTRTSHSAAGVLDMVEQASIVFDRLAAQWSTSYRSDRQPLLDRLTRARSALSGQQGR